MNIQIGDTTHDTLLDCVISGAPEDCMAACTEILQMLNRHEVVSVPVDSRKAGLIIGKGGANIKAIKQDLQTREETKCNPWIISGPKEDVREFLARLNARFGVCALGGLDTHRFVCPGCSLDFPNGTLMLAHVRNGACPATSCIAHDCAAVYADRDSCRKHESFCKKVQRCPGCSAPFASGSDLQSHVNLKGCIARACLGCQQIFTDADGLQLHQDSCEKYFEKKRDQEVREKIQDLKKVLCELCRLGQRKGSTCETCKAVLRRAQLQWHPDKNPDNEIVATLIFRSVQAVWDGQPQWLGDAERNQVRPKEGERPSQSAPVVPSDCCVQ